MTQGVENYSSSQQFRIHLVTDGVEESPAGTGWEISKGKPATKKIGMCRNYLPEIISLSRTFRNGNFYSDHNVLANLNYLIIDLV